MVLSRASFFAAGAGAATAAYLYTFDALWHRTEASAAALRAVAKELPDNTPVKLPVRPDPWERIGRTGSLLHAHGVAAVEKLQASAGR